MPAALVPKPKFVGLGFSDAQCAQQTQTTQKQHATCWKRYSSYWRRWGRRCDRLVEGVRDLSQHVRIGFNHGRQVAATDDCRRRQGRKVERECASAEFSRDRKQYAGQRAQAWIEEIKRQRGEICQVWIAKPPCFAIVYSQKAPEISGSESGKTRSFERAQPQREPNWDPDNGGEKCCPGPVVRQTVMAFRSDRSNARVSALAQPLTWRTRDMSPSTAD